MFIERVRFRNYKSLLDAELPLGEVTVIVGPNGSGKSSAIEGIFALLNPNLLTHRKVVSTVAAPGSNADVALGLADGTTLASAAWSDQNVVRPPNQSEFLQRLGLSQLISLEAGALAAPSQLSPNQVMQGSGLFLAQELDQLRDLSPERFDDLNNELNRWLPEFDRILFQTPSHGHRAILLRLSQNGEAIPAKELSFGTLAAVAFLTLAYRLNPPPLLCFEEPDRGVHPRLLPKLQEAIYRLAYPASFGEKREPTQIIVTTHSPYFLDLFKDHPEEVVLAEKVGESTTFRRLVDLPNAHEIFGAVPLGEAWFSGVLGGVPAA